MKEYFLNLISIYPIFLIGNATDNGEIIEILEPLSIFRRMSGYKISTLSENLNNPHMYIKVEYFILKYKNETVLIKKTQVGWCDYLTID